MRNRRRSGVVRGAEAAAVAAKVDDDVLICLDVTDVVCSVDEESVALPNPLSCCCCCDYVVVVVLLLCNSPLRAFRALIDSLGASNDCGESVVLVVDGFDWIDSSNRHPALLFLLCDRVVVDSGNGLRGSTRLGLELLAAPPDESTDDEVDDCAKGSDINRLAVVVIVILLFDSSLTKSLVTRGSTRCIAE